jgi:hypothetical protein
MSGSYMGSISVETPRPSSKAAERQVLRRSSGKNRPNAALRYVEMPTAEQTFANGSRSTAPTHPLRRDPPSAILGH